MVAYDTSINPASPVAVRRSARLAPHAGPLLVFAAAIVVLLGPSLVGARVVLPHDLLLERLPLAEGQSAVAAPANVELRDNIDTYYPVQHELIARIKSGRDASWLENVSLGLPGSSFIGWGAFSPFNLPALLLPFSLAWSWAMALRLFVAMLGAYVLARSIGISRAGATIAGLAFGLSGFMVGWLGWPQSHVGAFIPWTVWAAKLVAGATARTHTDPAVTTGPPAAPWWATLALALFTAGLWLGGFPAVAIYGLLGAGVVATHTAWTRRHAGWPIALRGVLRAAAAMLVGTGLVAWLLLPSLHTLAQFSTDYRGAAWTTALPLKTALTFLIPGFFGDVPQPHFWLGMSYVEAVAYAGALTAGLAVVAWLIVPRRRGIGLFTGLGLGTAAVVYGLPVAQTVLSKIPMLRDNVPTRSVVLLVLSLAVLAGLGMDALQRRQHDEAAFDRRLVMALTVITGLAGVVFLSVGPYRRVWKFARETLQQDFATEVARTASNASVRAVALVAAAVIVVAVSARLARRQPQLAAGVLVVGLVAVSAVDLLTFAAGRNVQVARAGLFPDAPGFAELREQSARYRVAGSDAVGLPNTHLEYGLRDVRAHAFVTARQTAVLNRMGAVWASPTVWDLSQVDSGRWQPWLSLLGVRTVLSPTLDDLANSLLVQPQQSAVLDSLIAGQVQQLDTVAPHAGELTGVKVLVGTFMRANAGVVKLALHTPDRVHRVTRQAQALEDLRWATFPLPHVAVQAGDALTVTVEGSTRDPAAAAALFGRAASADAGSAPAVALVYHSDAVSHRKVGQSSYLVDNPHARPVVDVFTRVEVVADGEAALQAIEAGGVAALQQRVVLEQPPTHVPQGGQARVSELRRDGGKIRATVHSERGAVLVVREQPLQDWFATVDGVASPLLNADVLFMAVSVPPGTHEVALDFHARGQTLGVRLSVLALLVLLTWTWWLRREVVGRGLHGDALATSEQEAETP